MKIQILISLLSVMLSCSHKKPERSMAKTSEVPVRQSMHYTTLVFNKGKAVLTQENKDVLKDLTFKVQKNARPIEEIRILAWPDTEYPNEVQGKGTQREIILASERAESIRDYLEEALKEDNDIDAYNMAKRPNLLSELFKSDEYKVKQAFETTGMTGDKLPDGNVSYTKASKALVIIDYEGTTDDLKR